MNQALILALHGIGEFRHIFLLYKFDGKPFNIPVHVQDNTIIAISNSGW